MAFGLLVPVVAVALLPIMLGGMICADTPLFTFAGSTALNSLVVIVLSFRFGSSTTCPFTPMNWPSCAPACCLRIAGK